MKYIYAKIIILLIFLPASLSSKEKLIEGKKVYYAYNKILEIYINHGKSKKEIQEISGSLGKRAFKEQNGTFKFIPESKELKDFDNFKSTVKAVQDVHDSFYHFMAYMAYEKVIYENEIFNDELIKTHKIARDTELSQLKIYVSFCEKELKDNRVKINVTAAVIAINKNLEILNNLKLWISENEKYKNFDQKN